MQSIGFRFFLTSFHASSVAHSLYILSENMSAPLKSLNLNELFCLIRLSGQAQKPSQIEKEEEENSNTHCCWYLILIR